jgi:REP element-mobilizing transposase RayT
MRDRRRFVPPGVFEITTRTFQSLYLLTPSRELNAAILGILGRAMSLYPVSLHAFVVMSNHVHLLVTPRDACALARFMQFFNANTARRVSKLSSWKGRLWGRRYQSIGIADELSQLGRMRYCLAHGCKECLVEHPADWPGLSSVGALANDETLVGKWLDQTAFYRARRKKDGHLAREEDFTISYPIELTPLPCWKGSDDRTRREAISSMIAEIVATATAARIKDGRRPLGAAAIYAQNRYDAPRVSKRSPAPRVHAATAESREAYLAAYDAFLRSRPRGRPGASLHVTESLHVT